MNSRNEPDWTLWRSFAAVIEHGSLSAAARALGASQPTLGRHIEALEQALGATLFERTLQGLRPKDTALKLYEQVEIAARALAEAQILADSSKADLSGTVRITGSVITSHYTLPPMIRQLREEFPAIQIELAPTDSAENLLMREADIAVRMFRPRQLELITRKIGDSPLICCAHRDYLARKGTPHEERDLYEHDLVGLDRSDIIIKVAADRGFKLTREDFALRTDSHTAGWELVKAGVGIGFAQEAIAMRTEGIVPLLPGFQIASLEVWLTTHRELFTSRRIRAIYDRLAELFAEYLARTPPAFGAPAEKEG